jgi:hypothetical protein
LKDFAGQNYILTHLRVIRERLLPAVNEPAITRAVGPASK